MVLPFWGQLQNAQDDDETIEEAINRIVAEHNDDDTSHLGEGQSLEAHKTEDVIDHPPGSVLSDKSTFNEIVLRSSFSSADGWTLNGNAGIQSFGCAFINIETGADENSSFVALPVIPYPFFDVDYDLLFQITSRFDIDDDDFSFAIGHLNSITTNLHGIGFVYEGGDLKAHAQNATSEVESSPISVDLSLPHVFRFHYQFATGKIKFFIDGVEVVELTLPSGSWSDEYTIRLQLYTSGDGIATGYFSDLMISRSLVN